MAEFIQASAADRRAALQYAAEQSGTPPYLLEKDIWVVWALKALFEGQPFSRHLVFKGGTSLSKAYGIIRRFSEDVDLTYDIHAIAGDLVGTAKNPAPGTRSQADMWTKEIRTRLPKIIADEIVPTLYQALLHQHLPATVRAQEDKAFIDYEPLMPVTAYVRSTVVLEFGARSSGEPHEFANIACDIARYVPNEEFPTAGVQVMRPERTFWEKATAIHVFCAQGAFRGGDRFSRLWHDLTRLDRSGFVDRAIANQALAQAVAAHKAAFFAEKDTEGNWIDYGAAVSGNLCLVPAGPSLARLADDYDRTVADGLLREDAEPFGQLVAECQRIQEKANRR